MSKTTTHLHHTPITRSGLAPSKTASAFPSCPVSLRPRPAGQATPTWEELLGRR